MFDPGTCMFDPEVTVWPRTCMFVPEPVYLTQKWLTQNLYVCPRTCVFVPEPVCLTWNLYVCPRTCIFDPEVYEWPGTCMFVPEPVCLSQNLYVWPWTVCLTGNLYVCPGTCMFVPEPVCLTLNCMLKAASVHLHRNGTSWSFATSTLWGLMCRGRLARTQWACPTTLCPSSGRWQWDEGLPSKCMAVTTTHMMAQVSCQSESLSVLTLKSAFWVEVCQHWHWNLYFGWKLVSTDNEICILGESLSVLTLKSIFWVKACQYWHWDLYFGWKSVSTDTDLYFG